MKLTNAGIFAGAVALATFACANASAVEAAPKPCQMGVTPETAQKIFTRIQQVSLAQGYKLDRVATQRDTLEIHWTNGTTECPPVRVDIEDCTAFFPKLKLTIPPQFAANCPGAMEAVQTLSPIVASARPSGDLDPKWDATKRVLRRIRVAVLAAFLSWAFFTFGAPRLRRAWAHSTRVKRAFLSMLNAVRTHAVRLATQLINWSRRPVPFLALSGVALVAATAIALARGGTSAAVALNAVVIMFWNPAPANASPIFRKRLEFAARIGGTLATGVVAYLWLAPTFRIPMPSHDGAFALLTARNCLDLADCHLQTSKSTVWPLVEGSVFPDIQIANLFLGGGAGSARMFVLTSVAASVAVARLVLWRWIHPVVGAAVATLAIALLAAHDPWMEVVDTGFVFVPSALGCLLLLLFGLTRDRVALVLSAVFLSHAANTHVQAFCLLPGLIAVSAVAGNSAWRSVALVATTFLVTTVVTSGAALLETLRSIATGEHFGLIAVPLRLAVAGMAILLAASVAGRSAFARMGRIAQSVWIGILMSGPFAAGFAVILIKGGSETGNRYMQTAIVPISLTLCASLAWMELRFRRPPAHLFLPGLAATVALVATVRSHAETIPAAKITALTMDDGAPIARSLARRGWSFERLEQHFAGGLPYEQLLTTVALSLPEHVEPKSDLQSGIRVELARTGEVTAARDRAEFVPVHDGWVAVIKEFRSWLDYADDVMCRTPLVGDSAELCESSTRPPPPEPPVFSYAERLYVTRFSLPPLGQIYRLTHTVLLRPRAGEKHGFAIDQGPSGCLKIVSADGLVADRPLPADRVRLTSLDGALSRLVESGEFGTVKCPVNLDRSGLPPLFETDDDDPRWSER